MGDCSEIDGNTDVICYQFVLAATKGFSSAVGILGVAVLYIIIFRYLLVWFMEGVYSPKVKSESVKLWSRRGWLALLIIPSLGGIIAFITIISVPFLNNIAFKTIESTTTFFAYWFCFAYVGPVVTMYVSASIRLSMRAEMRKRANTVTAEKTSDK